MIKYIRKFLSKLIIAIVCVTFACSAFGATNLSTGDIGDYGSWATEHNREAFVKTLNTDLTEFQPENKLVKDYVPIEARVGIAMMNGLTNIATILDTTLVRFMLIFIIVMYAFWIMLEAYNMMTTDSNVRKLVKSIVRKSVFLIIWISVLEIGPARLFMSVVGPVVAIGTYIADFILNAITKTAGISIPDTCNAIHQYAVATTQPDMIIDANMATDLLCLPTRLTTFFTTAIAVGWKWTIAGVGKSLFTSVIGVIFIVVFAWNAWKFTLMALSVIMNLFLGVLLLPFTAFAETIPQTSYKGIVGNIFNSFIGLFNLGPLKLDAQINRFINAAIYFVSLSIIIAICAALLSGVITPDFASEIPTLENNGFLPTLLTGALVAWLSGHADEKAREIGGEIQDNGTGKQFVDDIKGVMKEAYDNAKSWAKAIAKDKNK